MPNYWNQKDIPHLGWRLVTVLDVREDGQSEDDTNYESCMMCGQERIRYVHIVEHDNVAEEFRVGCTCASKMTNDYINPEKRERALRNRAQRKTTWLNKEWAISKKGNHYMKIKDRLFTLYQRSDGKYVIYTEPKIRTIFKSFYDAKIAIFDLLDEM